MLVQRRAQLERERASLTAPGRLAAAITNRGDPR
jgi:hypothetical protein